MSRPRDVVVIGGSAGAVSALFRILSSLPPHLEAAIALAIHRHPTFASSLGELFSRRSGLPVFEPFDGQLLEPGCVYLAPPDRHMVLSGRYIRLNREPKQHHTRPAIDPLFASAAGEYGPRVVGALLTGNLSDGVSGLIRIKELGGLSLVQDPDEAPFPSMPRNALIYDHVDLVFQVDMLGSVLSQLVKGATVQEALSTVGTRPVRESDIRAPGWLPRGHRLP